MWFERLTGFKETSPGKVRACLELSDKTLKSRVNGQSWTWGSLEVTSLGDLRDRAGQAGEGASLRAIEEVADVQQLHANPANSGALFQVASQFNLLEMVSPSVTPERGVGIYENDFTQGPACAIAAGAGTIYRNYFVPFADGIGQTEARQIDCLAELGAALGNTDEQLWKMRNGYALAREDGLDRISQAIRKCSAQEIDQLRAKLKVGIQWDTQVTLPGCSHLVSQVYCSAVPVAYSFHPRALWKDFASLVLEAAYEAALHAGVLNARRTGNKTVFLTLLGGGAFGNEEGWIIAALKRALQLHRNSDLDVRIVSFRISNPALLQFQRPV